MIRAPRFPHQPCATGSSATVGRGRYAWGPRGHVCVLAPVTQEMVHDYDGQHGLGDGRCADPYAGVVPPCGHDLGGHPGAIDGPPRQAQAGGRLQRDAGDDVLTTGDAPQHAAGVVAQEPARGDFVPVFRAFLGHAGEAGADLHALDGIDAHQCVGDVCVQPIEDRFTEPRRNGLGHHRHLGADGVPLLAQGIHVGLERRHGSGIRAKEGVLLHLFPVEAGRTDGPELGEIAAHPNPEPVMQVFLGDPSRGDPDRRLSGRGATPAPIVPHPVLHLVAVIRMAGPEFRGDLGVVLRALILIEDGQANGGARGPALEDAGEDPHLVGLAPLGGMAGFSGLTAVQIDLQVRLGERQAGGTTVHDAADGGPVALAEGGHHEEFTDAVSGHGSQLHGFNRTAVGPCPADSARHCLSPTHPATGYWWPDAARHH